VSYLVGAPASSATGFRLDHKEKRRGGRHTCMFLEDCILVENDWSVVCHKSGREMNQVLTSEPYTLTQEAVYIVPGRGVIQNLCLFVHESFLEVPISSFGKYSRRNPEFRNFSTQIPLSPSQYDNCCFENPG
jgi:hypothetical protein